MTFDGPALHREMHSNDRMLEEKLNPSNAVLFSVMLSAKGNHVHWVIVTAGAPGPDMTGV
jgi:hypothetical protein